jgi:predicted DNA-binding protein
MPTLSVKLAEETKQRLQSLAKNQGTTAHAVMVSAIEGALDTVEHHNALVASALRAREQVLASGKVLDGKSFGDYLKGKSRGQKAKRPAAVALKTFVSGT